MRAACRFILLTVVTIAFAGCAVGDSANDAIGEARRQATGPQQPGAWPFRPVRMRIHPLTQLSRDAETGQPLIDLYVECRDSFGHTTKALGKLRFSLHSGTDPEDLNIRNHLQTWTQDITDLEQNFDHYEWVTRLYRFNLMLPPGQQSRQHLIMKATLHTPEGELLSTTHILAR
ncbi:MAG: hypothetical protein KAS72_08455 [Phycisphaerales bacterium]|nr:hypothetical protein [Phycisphaerales bacterium]